MDSTENRSLKRYLSPLGALSLALGCAVGWGAFVMPGTTFLPLGGPFGTAIGMTLGGLIMVIIGYNYHYLMNRFTDAGGTYSYAKNIFGYDHGFLSSWFLILVYIAIIWANMTALPLIFRNSLGNFFQIGFHYEIAGYDVYIVEALLSVSMFFIVGFICMHGKKLAMYVQIAAAVILFGGVFAGFCVATYIHGTEIFYIEPAFVFDKSEISAVLGIAILSPWAFAGFESISNSTEEFNFSAKKSFMILTASVVISTFIYVFLGLVAIAALPEGYSNWFEYIGDLKNLDGFAKLPVLYSADHLFGGFGIFIFIATVSAAVLTGLLGNLLAASRLIFSMTRDEILPRWFGKLNDANIPVNAIFFILLVSIPIPFLGRTAISWIVDVNTIGATIAYAYTSAAAFNLARSNRNLKVEITGFIGCAISVLFFLYFMVPNFWTFGAMTTESYLILIWWCIMGFVFFRYIFQHDGNRRFGQSTVVWIVLLFLIFFTSMIWLKEASKQATEQVLENLNAYYNEELNEHGAAPDETEKADSKFYLESQMEFVNDSLTKFNVVQLALISVALFIMFNIYNLMMTRERKMELDKIKAEESNKAKSTFLSNMSHDIRTPMNAIIGYTTLLKKEENLPPLAVEYLDKIEGSNKHLLALINDVLDMSRIESGKMELDIGKVDLVKMMDEMRDLFATQMVTKSIDYVVKVERVENKIVMCDVPRLNRVLLNLISNAYKFTPEGGKVGVTLTQVGVDDDTGFYELRVKDTGIGMTPEFAAKVFEAYERDRSVSNIQGTGLGMAITKSIVELMGGTIGVKSELNKGTEFIVNLSFRKVDEEHNETENNSEQNMNKEIDFSKVHLLLVEDNEINREIAAMILTEFGFTLDTAENGKIAVEKISESKPRTYQAILMDIQMPVMNGYEATKKIRELKNSELSNIPIIAMTANAFAEDIQAAKNAGMNNHIAKPIDIPTMIATLTEVLKNRS
ncbi:MAG: amino acid permease [Selenomonadaceae bacterium]|nr:amino acid permease [Selenomonadaceae bacterium]